MAARRREGTSAPIAPADRPLIVCFVLGLLTVLAWPNLFLNGQVPVDGNVLRLFYPNWAFLHAHPPAPWHVPLWNPHRNMGEPFLADPQSLASYPPMWVLCRLPDYLSFMRLWILGHTLLAAYFTRKWVLRLSGDSAAATVSAIVIAFNGYFVAHGTLPNHFAAAAYLPAVLYFFDAGSVVGLSAALALQWLAGFPPFSYLTGLALLSWSVSAGPARRRLLWKSAALAAGLAAVQLIPFAELFIHSSRPIVLSPTVAADFSEPWGQLARMVAVPQWLTWMPQMTGDQAVVSFYVGPFVLLAALGALWKGRRRERLLSVAILVCALLSLGSHLPGYAQLIPLHVFRFPANWLVLSAMGLAVLSGLGVARLTGDRWKWLSAALILADLLVFAQHGRTPWFKAAYLSEPPPLAQALMPASATDRIYTSPAVVQGFSQRGLKNFSDWVFLREALAPSYGMAFGLREVSSYQVMKLARAERYQERLALEGPSSPLVRWAGISTVVARTPGTDASDPRNIQAVSIKDSNLPLFFENQTLSQHVVISAYQAGRIDATVTTDRSDTLVFSEVAYPGWDVRLDGETGRPGVFHETFLSALVPPGQHTVVFHYRPMTFWIGLAITVGALVFVTFLIFLRGRERLVD